MAVIQKTIIITLLFTMKIKIFLNKKGSLDFSFGQLCVVLYMHHYVHHLQRLNSEERLATYQIVVFGTALLTRSNSS